MGINAYIVWLLCLEIIYNNTNYQSTIQIYMGINAYIMWLLCLEITTEFSKQCVHYRICSCIYISR